MKRIVSFLLSLFALLFCGFFALFGKNTSKPSGEKSYSGILRLWHIDSFEGGKGSRASFLNKAAGKYEKQHDGLYIMVSGYTVEGAEAALSEGVCPDLLSFSCGVEGAAQICRALNLRFEGGVVGDHCYAYPWCGGKYYFFCLENDFSSLSAENLLISDGGNNLPWVAASLYGITGEAQTVDSTSAYVQFLNGKCKYLLGTQRDVCRFDTRGVSVYRQEINEYSDLYQYIAVTAKEEKDVAACMGFVDFLLSSEIQESLADIGMYSVKDTAAENTLSAFVSKAGLQSALKESRRALRTGEIKILKTYLKSLN